MQEVFEAESLPDDQIRDADLKNALELDEASFSWDAPPPEPEGGKGKGNGKDKGKKAKDQKKDKKGKKRPGSRGTDATVTPPSGSVPGSSRVSTHEPEKSEKVFKIKKTSVKIPRGQVVAIVGPVGSGKSSLLQGLIGEMRRESGSVKFGGSVSYCPQVAWIQVRSLVFFFASRNTLTNGFRTLPSARIFASVDLSIRIGIGRPFRPRAWRQI